MRMQKKVVWRTSSTRTYLRHRACRSQFLRDLDRVRKVRVDRALPRKLTSAVFFGYLLFMISFSRACAYRTSLFFLSMAIGSRRRRSTRRDAYKLSCWRRRGEEGLGRKRQRQRVVAGARSLPLWSLYKGTTCLKKVHSFDLRGIYWAFCQGARGIT